MKTDIMIINPIDFQKLIWIKAFINLEFIFQEGE